MSFKQIGIREYILMALIIVVIVVLINIYIKNSNNIKEKIKGNNNQGLKTSHQIDMSSIKIENRETLQEGQIILIGNNTKELENGFFDIHINTSKLPNEIIIYINKLWYKGFEEDYIDDLYLMQIIEYIARISNINEIEQNKNKVFKYIKEEYKKTKSENKKFKTIKIKENVFKSVSEEGLLKVTMSFKKENI